MELESLVENRLFLVGVQCFKVMLYLGMCSTPQRKVTMSSCSDFLSGYVHTQSHPCEIPTKWDQKSSQTNRP